MAGSHIALRTVLNRSVIALLVAGMPQRTLAVNDPFAGLAAVSDEKLEHYRGGFENAHGIQFSFAIERAIVVNGELISTTRIVLNDLSPLLTGGVPTAEVIASARSIVQSGLGNTVTPLTTPTTPAPAASAASTAAVASSQPPAVVAPATPSTAAPVTAVASQPVTTSTPLAGAVSQSATPTNIAAPSVSAVTTSPPATGPSPSAPTTAAVPGPAAPAAVEQPATPVNASAATAPVAATTPAATTQAANSTPGTLYIQMNAGGQTILVPNANAIVTAVQNTVNNQVIQARTTIDATLNSLSALRSAAFAESLRLQALESVRRQ